MMGLLKAVRILGLACVMWLGVSLDANEAKANVADYICAVNVSPASYSAGSFGAIEVVLSDISCSPSLMRSFFFCSSGAHYGLCAAKGADLIGTSSYFKKLTGLFESAKTNGLQPKFTVGTCRDTSYSGCPKAKPVTFVLWGL